MAFDLSNLSITEFALIIVIFVLFVLGLRKTMKIVKNAIFVAVASVLFPIIARFLGFPIAADADSIIFFLTLGLGLYAIYVIAWSVYTVLGIAERSMKKTPVAKYVQKKTAKKEQEEDEEEEE
jgi:hypothetical protein